MKHAHPFIRFIEGADGAAGGAPAPDPTPTPDPAPDPTPTLEDITADRDRLAAEVETLRHEAAASRVNAKSAAVADALAPIVKILGLEDGTDPAALLAAVTTARDGAAQAKASRVTADLVTVAMRAGLDPDALRDSRSFASKLEALDPDATDYDAALKAAVDEVKDSARFRATPTPGRSGVDGPSGSGEGQVTAAQFKAMSISERSQLFQRDPGTYRALSALSAQS
jgi:hypothetical protein